MAVEHFDLASVANWIRSRECARRHPKEFWIAFLGGAVVTATVALLIAGIIQQSIPILRPTLQLASDTVPVGGNIGFIQAPSQARYCPQENVRLLWRWTDDLRTKREMFFLSDVNFPPRVWNGPTTINIPVPTNIEPGIYYYVRESQTYCTWWAHLTGRPNVERTPDVRISIVSAAK